MTTCILSGFARPKKYVGGVYACDGSDLPQTQDFGTIQYQGPFEAAQTVPATTIDYAIIGKTPCGDTVRRITTMTYSSRGIANQFKTSGFVSVDSRFSPYPVNASGLGYGSTIAVSYTNFGISVIPQLPNILTILTGYSSPANATVSRPHYVEPDPHVILYKADSNFTFVTPGLPVFVTDDDFPYSTVTSGIVTSQITLYYLDVHEVWTYDLVS